MDPTPTPRRARLTEQGSFRLLGHPHYADWPPVTVELRADGTARAVRRARDGFLLGAYVGPGDFTLEDE